MSALSEEAKDSPKSASFSVAANPGMSTRWTMNWTGLISVVLVALLSLGTMNYIQLWRDVGQLSAKMQHLEAAGANQISRQAHIQLEREAAQLSVKVQRLEAEAADRNSRQLHIQLEREMAQLSVKLQRLESEAADQSTRQLHIQLQNQHQHLLQLSTKLSVKVQRLEAEIADEGSRQIHIQLQREVAQLSPKVQRMETGLDGLNQRFEEAGKALQKLVKDLEEKMNANRGPLHDLLNMYPFLRSVLSGAKKLSCLILPKPLAPC